MQMAYKVFTNAENTGLDGVVFASKGEADSAVSDCVSVFADVAFSVISTSEPANSTYEEWSETGW